MLEFVKYHERNYEFRSLWFVRVPVYEGIKHNKALSVISNDLAIITDKSVSGT